MSQEQIDETTAAAQPDPESAGSRVRHLIVSAEDGQRIDNFLARVLRGVPKSRLYRMLRTGEVRVNGGRVKPTHRVAIGDRIRIPPVQGLRNDFDASGAPVGAGEGGRVAAPFIGSGLLDALERSILFEDDGILAIDKPSGLPVHGGSGLSFGAIEAMRKLRPGCDLHLVHRLDRDTSGCLLLAKSRKLLLELHRALRERTIKKRYSVIVHGRWPRRTTQVQLPLEKFLLASGERRVRVTERGKPSRTDFAVRAFGGQASWLDARLHTGRTHQIRVHAQATGHAVVGDEKYASVEQLALARSLGIRRLCLHAAELVFMHEGVKLRIEAPEPDDFLQAWSLLGGAADGATALPGPVSS